MTNITDKVVQHSVVTSCHNQVHGHQIHGCLTVYLSSLFAHEESTQLLESLLYLLAVAPYSSGEEDEDETSPRDKKQVRCDVRFSPPISASSMPRGISQLVVDCPVNVARCGTAQHHSARHVATAAHRPHTSAHLFAHASGSSILLQA